MAPAYHFSINPMRPRIGSPIRTSRSGLWLPPKAFGNNVSLRPNAAHFYHDGQTTVLEPAIPSHALLYKTYSIYYNRATVWTINYDATLSPVHNGVDTNPTEADGGSIEQRRLQQDEQGWGDDWISMSFRHLPYYVSYAGRNLEEPRLRVQRPDQFWAQQILPDPYTAMEQTPDLRHGGLLGDLPLLIGLMMLSIPESHTIPESDTYAIPELIGRHWHPVHPSTLERGIGWQDGRGLVVTVYANPPESILGDLYRHETGGYGLILP